MKAVNHEELKKIAKRCYETKRALYVWGGMGIGKSEAIKELANELGIGFTDVRLTTLEPSDMRGLPKLDGNVVKWIPPEWLPQDKDSKGILFFDEFNHAFDSMQKAAFQLVLDRKMGSSYELPDGWWIIAAGNRIEDRSNVFELSAALANRFCHVELKTPTIDQWEEWAWKNKVDPRIIAFLKFRGDRLYSFKADMKDKAWASPRTWWFTSQLIDTIPTEDIHTIETLAATSVGEGIAVEFSAWLNLQKQIDVKAILDDPKQAQEITEVSLRYALLAAVTDYYKRTHEKDPKVGKIVLDKIMKLCSELEAEFAIMLIRMTKAVDEAAWDKNVDMGELRKYKKYLVS